MPKYIHNKGAWDFKPDPFVHPSIQPTTAQLTYLRIFARNQPGFPEPRTKREAGEMIQQLTASAALEIQAGQKGQTNAFPSHSSGPLPTGAVAGAGA